MIKNLNFIFKKKNIYKIILYLLIYFIVIFFAYFFTPNFFNYSPQLIEESLKQNNNFNIKNISKVSYKAFPTPRLRISGSNFTFEEDILEVDGSEIDIILNSSSILNYKRLDYNKLLIKGGSTKININNANQLLNYFKKNKQKIFFKENNLILVQNNKDLFEINDSIIKVISANNQQQLTINGIFLNHKITFLLDSKLENKSNITFKIPELDISSSIFLENKDNFSSFNGLVNFEVLNNFFQIIFTKDKNIKINKGYIRNNLINSSFEGDITFKPNFFLNLDFEPTILNIEKLFPIIQKKFFSDDPSGLEIIKKINGSFSFKTKFEGNMIFENGEILFKNFKIGKNNSLFFDAKIFEFGKKGKIQFNLFKIIQYKKNFPKELKISGFIIPSASKVTFEKMLLNNKDYAAEKIKNYEKKFENEVIQNLLSNIFNDSKMSDFFKNFVN